MAPPPPLNPNISRPPAPAPSQVRAAAWEHAKLGDIRFLPVDRTRLMQILVKWGAFPHIEGGSCKGCFHPQPSPANPYLMNSAPRVKFAPGTTGGTGTGAGAGTGGLSAKGAGEEGERWAQPRAAPSPSASPLKTPRGGAGDLEAGATGSPGPTLRATGSPGPAGAGGTWKSLQFRGGEYQLAASWVLNTQQWANQTKTQPLPHLMTHVPDKYARTHTIIAASEAVYCTEPFFKWRLPDGSAIHVGMHDNLYRDLIPLLDSVAASVEYMREHMERVRRFNESRTRQGRFLLGHQLVERCEEGVGEGERSRVRLGAGER